MPLPFIILLHKASEEGLYLLGSFPSVLYAWRVAAMPGLSLISSNLYLQTSLSQDDSISSHRQSLVGELTTSASIWSTFKEGAALSICRENLTFFICDFKCNCLDREISHNS